MSGKICVKYILVFVLIGLFSSSFSWLNQLNVSSALTSGLTELVSVSPSGDIGNGSSSYPLISANGRFVAFSSRASNLVSGDTNGLGDVFIRDRQTSTTERVSLSSSGRQGNHHSSLGGLSSDGRFVVINSNASNLVTNDTNEVGDVFVRDRQTSMIERISLSSMGDQGNNHSTGFSISDNGRFVTFGSWASNLVSTDTNEILDVFVRDRQTSTTERVSVSTTGEQGNGGSVASCISADGRFVAFDSWASNLVSGDTNGTTDVFIRDRETGITEIVSVSSNGEQGNGWSSINNASISADGGFVVFESEATNLVSNDTNGTNDVFIRDRETGITERVSVSPNGEQGNGWSGRASISADGRFVAFISEATNLISSDMNGYKDVFIHNRQTGITERVSVSSTGEEGNYSSQVDPAISAYGRFVTFSSLASNLVSDDTNGVQDVFIRDRCPDGLCRDTNDGVEIMWIEINQSIQDETNDVKLIAEKPTLARVYVDCGLGCQSVPNVTGGLDVSSDRGDISLPPVNKYITAYHSTDWRDQRGDLTLTLNFQIPSSLLSGNVQITANVMGKTLSVTKYFEDGADLRIAWVRLDYEVSNQYYIIAKDSVTATGDKYMRHMFPLGQNDLDYFFQDGIIPMQEKFICNEIVCPADKYLAALNQHWDWVDKTNGWKDGKKPDRLFGWLPMAARVPEGMCGRSDPIWYGGEGKVAAGADYCDKSNKITKETLIVDPASVFSHEVGHILSNEEIMHTPNPGPEQDINCFATTTDVSPTYYNTQYPNLIGKLDDFGIHAVAYHLFTPQTDYDFMSYCTPIWISKHNYEKIAEGFATPSTVIQTADTYSEPIRQLLVSGLVTFDPMTAVMDPFYEIISESPPDPDFGGDYCFELRDSSNIMLDKRCFTLSFFEMENGFSTNEDYFSLSIPFPYETNSILFKHKTQTLASIALSEHAPAVSILSPNGGENWDGHDTIEVKWSATDNDGDELYYALEYSTNGGFGWFPIAVDLTSTSREVDLSKLPGGEAIMLRVRATDGVNTTYDTTNGLFTVGKKAPKAFILPLEFETIPPGFPIYLQGYAYDLEDGTLANTALSWNSNVDGFIGSGKIIIVNLTPGGHLITLTAMDSDRNSTSDTIKIHVGYKIFLPFGMR
jgi:hypothetical protein